MKNHDNYEALDNTDFRVWKTEYHIVPHRVTHSFSIQINHCRYECHLKVVKMFLRGVTVSRVTISRITVSGVTVSGMTVSGMTVSEVTLSG